MIIIKKFDIRVVVVVVLLEKQCFGNQITEKIDKLNRGVNGNGISNAAESMERHSRINKSDNWNVKFESLVNNRRLALSIDNDDAIGRLSGTEAKFLVARSKLLGTVAVGEKSTSTPERIGRGTVASNLFGHKFEDFIEERIGVDEHESTIMASKGRDEIDSTSHTNQSLIGIDDCHSVAKAVSVIFEMMSGDLTTNVCICAKKLLYHYRMNRHASSRLIPIPIQNLQCF